METMDIELEFVEDGIATSSVYLYPLQFGIETRTDFLLQTDSRRARRRPPPLPLSRRGLRSRWSPYEEWFLSKILESKLDIIEPSSISEMIEPIVIKEYEAIKKINDDMFSYITSLIQSSVHAPSIYLNENTLGFFGRDSGLFMLISNSIDEIEPLVTSIKSSASELASITSDLGVSLTGIYSGADYARNTIESKASSIKIGEYKNEFEKEVHDQIEESITNSLISNIELTFSESAETYEYDTVICLDSSRIIQVSCKDYSTVKEETQSDSTRLRNRVIIQPKDKAEFIDAECFVVLRGFSEQLLREYKAFGKPRKVTILDDSEYLEVLKRNLIISTIEILRSSMRR